MRQATLGRRGGLCKLGAFEGMKTAIAEANKALDSVSKEIVQSVDFPFLPPTLNELLSAGKSRFYGRGKLSRLKRDFTSKACLEISSQGLIQVPDSRVWIEFVWFCSFRRDHDNVAVGLKFLLDALQQSRIIPSDNLKTIQSPVEHWHERTPKGEADHVIMTIANTPRHNLERNRRYASLVSDALDRF